MAGGRDSESARAERATLTVLADVKRARGVSVHTPWRSP